MYDKFKQGLFKNCSPKKLEMTTIIVGALKVSGINEPPKMN